MWVEVVKDCRVFGSSTAPAFLSEYTYSKGVINAPHKYDGLVPVIERVLSGLMRAFKLYPSELNRNVNSPSLNPKTEHARISLPT